MRWLRILKDCGVAAQQDEGRSADSRSEAGDANTGVIFVYSAFGWYCMEPNSDPLEPPGFMMKVA
jgi:hypothetical protein